MTNARTAANRRAKTRATSSNAVLRDAWERHGVLVCGQCSKSLIGGLAGVVPADAPDDILQRVTCSPACVAALTP